MDEKEVEWRNNYRNSESLKYGDMPKVFAFEVENNIVEAVKTILAPMFEQHAQLKADMADSNAAFKRVDENIGLVNARLDHELDMRDMVKDTNKRFREIQNSLANQNDDLWKQVQEIQHMSKGHD